MSWARRRQLLYGTLTVVILLAIGGWFLYRALSTPPTCADGVQNGTERGIDCGGTCARICPFDAREPVILWQQSFETSPGVYTSAAYVKNNNANAGARSVKYAFRLYDENNILLVEREGVFDIPPMPTVPLIEANVVTGTRKAARTFLELSEVPQWEVAPAQELPSLRITDQVLSSDASRLSATLVNEGISDATNITLTAVLFDADGIAHAAGKSVIARIPRAARQSVVFTWPASNPDIVRAEITAVPPLP